MQQHGKILIAEDNDFVRMQIVKFLNDERYETVESTDGREALDKMDDTIALAIVDLRMEPIGGFDFVRHIRGLDLKTPVILVTGDQNPDILSEASKWGVAAVLMKPVEKARLVQTVARIFGKQKRI